MTAPRAIGPFGALQSANFRLFLGGQLVSLCGTWLQSVALSWLVLQLSNSPLTVGLVAMLGSLPILLFTLYGGVIADRVDKRRTVFWLQAAMLLEALILAGLTTFGLVTTTWVMVLAFTIGLLTAFEVPMRQALFADLVERKDLGSAIALNSAVYNLARVLGPALGGVLIGLVGVAACFYLNAVSYVAVLWSLRRLDLPRAGVKPPSIDAMQSFREGLRFIWKSTWPRTLMLMAMALTIFGYCVLSMLAVYARDALHLGAGGYGIITAAVGLGAMLAALGLAAAGTRLRHGRLAAWSASGFGVVLLLVGLAPSPWVAAPLLLLTGALIATTGVATNTFLQQQVPDELRGRIMGFYSFVVLGMVPFGSLQVGFVAEHFGVRTAFVVCGGLSLLTGLVVVWRRRGRDGW